jgi:predicted RNase H-like HicB family nuclease
MEHKYRIVIDWSQEDNAFIAEVPELPGCMADGKSYQEARANIELAIEWWIQAAQEENRPIPEPRWGKV